ncbi:hypothetical protein C8R45DRAFT_463482 [Mycena sanguinolenta]|nr:hypothetical protein C8R45DRAFT_463482 [Mycena sanguinolenta]
MYKDGKYVPYILFYYLFCSLLTSQFELILHLILHHYPASHSMERVAYLWYAMCYARLLYSSYEFSFCLDTTLYIVH